MRPSPPAVKIKRVVPHYLLLEDTAGYASLLLGPAEGFSQGQGFLSGLQRSEIQSLVIPLTIL